MLTLHRPANVDDPTRLREMLGALARSPGRRRSIFRFIRGRGSNLERAGIAPPPGIRLVEPLGYLDFLASCPARRGLSDSGGIQEETTALGVPCLTLRENTERPSTIEEGSNVLAGTRRESILRAWEGLQRHSRRGRVPRFWDGQAAARCRKVLRALFLLESPPADSAPALARPDINTFTELA